MIYRCFDHISEQDAHKFVRKFKDQLTDNTQVMHTFRELVLGAYLGSIGLNVRYEHQVDKKTPDWCILSGSSALFAIVELVNFHVDKVTQDRIERQLENTGFHIGWQQPNDFRLYDVIRRKANLYRELVKVRGIPYIVAVFGEFWASVNLDELHSCLYGSSSSIFARNQDMSGVLFFEEQSGRYRFTYLPNPNASFGLDIRNGELS